MMDEFFKKKIRMILDDLVAARRDVNQYRIQRTPKSPSCQNFKKAIVTPLLKKPDMDRNAEKSHRPISNLPFLSKILEKVVSKTLNKHRCDNLNVKHQSAYRQHHSTETALLKV